MIQYYVHFLYKNELLENLCSITKMIIMQKNQHLIQDNLNYD